VQPPYGTHGTGPPTFEDDGTKGFWSHQFWLLDSQENHYICCHQTSDFRAKCPKFNLCWGSAPDPTGGAYSAPLDPLAERDLVLMEKEGRRRKGKGTGRGREKGKNRKRREKGGKKRGLVPSWEFWYTENIRMTTDCINLIWWCNTERCPQIWTRKWTVNHECIARYK